MLKPITRVGSRSSKFGIEMKSLEQVFICKRCVPNKLCQIFSYFAVEKEVHKTTCECYMKTSCEKVTKDFFYSKYTISLSVICCLMTPCFLSYVICKCQGLISECYFFTLSIEKIFETRQLFIVYFSNTFKIISLYFTRLCGFSDPAKCVYSLHIAY